MSLPANPPATTPNSCERGFFQPNATRFRDTDPPSIRAQPRKPVFGLVTYAMVLFGMPLHSWPVSLARASYLSGGAIFPISFLQLWWRPLPPETWQCRGSRWLLSIARFNAFWLVPLLFACSFIPN